MNIVFMGTPEFAVPSLEALLARSYTISAVVTAPDAPRGRGRHLGPPPVKECAFRHSLPVLQPVSLKDPSFAAAIRSLAPDLIVVVAFRILPKEIFTIPSLGTFNLHASLLPKYRGAAPINWALINGEKETGVTTFYLQESVDTGNIILQARVNVGEETTAGELHDLLSDVGADVVVQTVRLIELGKAEVRKQDDGAASPAPKLFKETCRIDWHRPAEHIRNFIRGLSPSPAAWTTHKGKGIKLYKSSRRPEVGSLRSDVGKLSVIEGRLLVGTQNGTLEILELQQEGKRRMSAEEFLRGYRFDDGDRFD
jgi:methionyl-tRNA formyltransferase